jgi:AraC-like DNA-binding protein
MDSTAPRRVDFNTDAIPERDRFAAFREVYGRTILKHDVEPIGGAPFHFEATLYSLPGLGLATSTISPCRATRNASHIAGDDFILGVCIDCDGPGAVHQRRREAIVNRGEAVLTSSAETSDLVLPYTSRRFSLRLSRQVIAAKGVDLDGSLSRTIAKDNPALLLLTKYGGILENSGLLTDPALCDLAVAHIYDLASLVLGAEGDRRQLAEDRGVRAARRAVLLREIERRSGDAELSAITIASALGVTPRYVHQLLEETGRTFTHHVLEWRLQKALGLLRDPRWREHKIAAVAMEAGFGDVSYFNRAFRRRFGATPSDIRATNL